jgi:hypothetical protein
LGGGTIVELTEIYVNDQEVAGEYIAQAFFEWKDEEWEMAVRASSKEAAEQQAREQAEAYLKEWAEDAAAANDKYGVYPF